MAKKSTEERDGVRQSLKNSKKLHEMGRTRASEITARLKTENYQSVTTQRDAPRFCGDCLRVFVKILMRRRNSCFARSLQSLLNHKFRNFAAFIIAALQQRLRDPTAQFLP